MAATRTSEGVTGGATGLPPFEVIKQSILAVLPREGYEHLEYVIPVCPVPCPRPRVTQRGITYYPKNYTDWKKAAAQHIPDSLSVPAGQPAILIVEHALPPFKTVQRAFPKGDVDNYLKSLMDAIGPVKRRPGPHLADDAQVVGAWTAKRFIDTTHEDPHTRVYIREL